MKTTTTARDLRPGDVILDPVEMYAMTGRGLDPIKTRIERRHVESIIKEANGKLRIEHRKERKNGSLAPRTTSFWYDSDRIVEVER